MSKWHKKHYGKPDSNFRINTKGSRRHEVEEMRFGVWHTVGTYTMKTMAQSALDRLELQHVRRVVYNQVSNRRAV